MTFEYYPHLATTNSKLCHFALYKLFLVLSYHPTVVLKNFMSHISKSAIVVFTSVTHHAVVYQGLVRSCSYPVVIDVVSDCTGHACILMSSSKLISTL